ncbi:MAG TPA: DUF4870 domain-containing protein [Roseimicrobium sp.]|nr:DUF4870 domain-containing protein [Roseimicrobium sp.]
MNETPPPIRSGYDKLWIVLSHLCPFVGAGIILPLIVYLVKRGDSEPVAYHAKEALNFQISTFLYALVCAPLILVFGIGFLLLIALGIAVTILSIVAAVKASDGAEYRYPFCIRLIK